MKKTIPPTTGHSPQEILDSYYKIFHMPIKYNYFFIFIILDYDASLSEAGDITPKYHAIKDVIAQYAPKQSSE